MEDKTVHIRLPKDLFDKIQAEAKRLNIPISTFIKMVLSEKFG